jgi:hypothetical protein
VLCARICQGLDPTHVGIWVCRCVDEYPGLPYLVEDDLGYCKRDVVEFGPGEVVIVSWISSQYH